MRFDDYFDFDNLPWPFGQGQRRRQGPRKPRRGWRWFQRGDLKFAILALIAEKPMHGYEVMQALEEQSEGGYRASPGSVYPTLQLLEDQGYLVSQDYGGRKVYSITDQGRDYLDEHQDHVKRIFDRVSRFGDKVGREMGSLSRRLARLTRTTFQGAVSWVEDEQLFGDMKAVLDRAVKDMDAAWDAARQRRKAARADADGGDDGDDENGENGDEGERRAGNGEQASGAGGGAGE